MGFLSLFAKDFNSLRSDFLQTITSPEGSILSYKGELFAKKTNLALWKYKSPVKKSIYFLNDTVLVFEPDLEQVIISKISQVPNIQHILNSAKKGKDGVFYSTYEGVKFSVTLKNNLPKAISYKDKLDNKVDIKFLNPDVDVKLDDKVFSYQIPKDYDVVKN